MVDDRRAPRLVDPRLTPHDAAVRFIQGDQLAAFHAGVDDDRILVEYRRAARSERMDALATIGPPQFFARSYIDAKQEPTLQKRLVRSRKALAKELLMNHEKIIYVEK